MGFKFLFWVFEDPPRRDGIGAYFLVAPQVAQLLALPCLGFFALLTEWVVHLLPLKRVPKVLRENTGLL